MNQKKHCVKHIVAISLIFACNTLAQTSQLPAEQNAIEINQYNNDIQKKLSEELFTQSVDAFFTAMMIPTYLIVLMCACQAFPPPMQPYGVDNN